MIKKAATTRSTSASKSSKAPLASSVLSLHGELSPEARVGLLKEMTASIRKHGQRVPIVMRGRQIVDGNLRWNACQALGIKPNTVDVSALGKPISDVDLWMVLNDARRHLSLNERGLLAVHYSAGSTRGVNQHSTGINTKTAAGERFGVSTDLMANIEKALHGGGAEARKRLIKGDSPTAVLRDLKSVEQGKQVAAIRRENGDAALAFEDLIAKGEGKVCGNADPRRHYPTMTLEDIEDLPVSKIAAKDSVCWLWVPNCLVPDGLRVLKAWGFNYSTCMVWEKTAAPPSKGAILPYHEMLLVGKRGSGLKHIGKPAKSVYKAANPGRVHSRKPAWFADEIDRLYPKAGKIELFCRVPRKGWIAWGNEAKGAGQLKAAAKKLTRTR
jgi:N6-adenosine-specific RNA methylase IME4